MNLRRVALLALALASCAGPSPATDEASEVPMTLTLTSTAFAAGEAIPAVYSCDGKGISPPLAWSGAPAGTKSFALIMDDPDAPLGTFVHWVIYNMPSASAVLVEAVAKDVVLPDGSLQGPNSIGRAGYTGPCPPGGTHRYFFKLYALNTTLESGGLGKDQLLKAMQGHILAQGELMGTFTRK
ncbi:MAG TPA: YbhB/YbcL family Raf kinase inhibitor-like protein [Anaerolineales bacterium]